MMIKGNDIICYRNEIYVINKEIYCNLIYDPMPHCGFTLLTLSGKMTDVILIDDEYDNVEILVRR